MAAALAVRAQPFTSTKVFTGARLIDGTGRAPIDNAIIVVREGRIAAAGPAAGIALPEDAERISLAGLTVVPGLINAHGHVSDPSRDLRVYAAYGATTVFSLGGEGPAHVAAREAQARPALDRTRIFIAGEVVTGPTPGDARTAVARKRDVAEDGA